jgi:hypothetical protein
MTMTVESSNHVSSSPLVSRYADLADNTPTAYATTKVPVIPL